MLLFFLWLVGALTFLIVLVRWGNDGLSPDTATPLGLMTVFALLWFIFAPIYAYTRWQMKKERNRGT
jgi:hypothetical protein